MKVTVFLLTISILGAFASGTYSQTTKLTLQFNNTALEKVLGEIENQSEFRFFYNENVNVRKEVTVNSQNKSVFEILDYILGGTEIKYRIIGRQIALYNQNESFNPTAISSGVQIQVQGRVTDSSGTPLPGVTVVIKNTTQGTITDANGNYSFSNVPGDATLVFSFVGMKNQEISVSGKTKVDVIMAEETVGIEEVVAIGYGTQRRLELTSAVSSVKSSDFIKGSTTDAGQLIKGKIAGVTIVNADGNPTSQSQILLRGVTTLTSESQPLIMIDGVPGNLMDVVPEDIESIDILKDGSAAAIYGTRGTNGVILITTKKAKGVMPATIEYSGYVTTQSISKRLEFMSADEYRQLAAQSKSGARDFGASTDWLKEITQNPVSQTHNISLKGGNSSSNYIMNINYKELEGLIKKSNKDELNVRIEANHSMFDGRLKINGNISGYDRKYAIMENDQSTFDFVYRNGLVYNPTDPVKDENGNWTEHTEMYLYSNPVALLNESDGSSKETHLRSFGSISVLPFNGLTIKVLASRDLLNITSGYAESFNHLNSIRNSRKGYAAREGNRFYEDLFEVTANYSTSLNKHNITILGGYSYNSNSSESFSMSNYDFSSDFYTYNNMGNGLALANGKASMKSNKISSKLISSFSRVDYNYNDKYILKASIRYEGSSKFGQDHKWGAFPSISAGWNIIKEPFMKGIRSTVDILKIRGGFGITGTVPNASYQSLDRLSYGDKYLYNGTWISVIYSSSNPNPDLKWEKKEETNVGIDFAILNNRISGSVDIYKRTSKDLLWTYNVPSPPYLYSTMFANAGSIENKGIEILLSATPHQTTALEWNTSITYSTNSNKMLSFSNTKFQLRDGYSNEGDTGEPIQTYTHRISEGGPIGNFYGWRSVDVDDNGYWIIEGKDGTPKSIVDAQPEDKKVIGNGLPKHYLSWNNTINYKKFDLNISMRGAFAYQILNYPHMFHGQPISLTRGNVLKTTYNDIYNKRPLAEEQSLYYVSYFLEDGDYWKIDNITLGYTLPLNKKNIKNVRLYISGSNLFTFTGYSGIDPEVNSLGRSPGIDDQDRYPSTRSYTLGVSVKF